MKIVIGIVLTVLLIGALGVYLVLMLTAQEMVFCGDIKNNVENGTSVTRVYITDYSANETLSEIVDTVNASDGESVSVDEITEIMAKYQSVIYAPVFNISTEQIDTTTYVVEGSIYNGIDSKGRPVEPDYTYENLRLSAVVRNGVMISAENIYEVEKGQEDKLVEREKTIAPILQDKDSTASFAFEDCDSFRFIFQGTAEIPADVTLVFTYDVVAESPLNFTHVDNGVLAVNMQVAHNDDGWFVPAYECVRNITVKERN
ncbi:MAG: hypothetical protein IJZ47_00860 [Oscillospiraceae bacterium]|nr:hypothetical protein [Oscillospiraceae bacterium]